MGEVDIFSPDEKSGLALQARERLFKTSQPTSCFVSGLEGKILQRLPCFRTQLQGTALLALAFMEKSAEFLVASLLFLSAFFFFCCDKKGNLKKIYHISFFSPNLELFRRDSKELLCLSPALKNQLSADTKL